MGEIYANCEIALVWLGKDETDLKGFLAVHDLLEPIIRQRDTPDSDIGGNLRSAWTLQDLRSALGGRIAPHAWTAYVSFYEKRRWFSRVWVAQEVALPRETIILCGHEIIQWDRIQMIKDFLRDSLAIELVSLRSVHHGRPAGYEVATLSRLKKFHDGSEKVDGLAKF